MNAKVPDKKFTIRIHVLRDIGYHQKKRPFGAIMRWRADRAILLQSGMTRMRIN